MPSSGTLYFASRPVVAAAHARRGLVRKCSCQSRSFFQSKNSLISSSNVMKSKYCTKSVFRPRHPRAHFSSMSASDKKKDRSDGEKEPQKIKTNFKTALFPRNIPDPEDQGDNNKRIQYPKTFAGWKRVFSCTWKNYRYTWEGFMGSSDDDTKKKEEKTEVEVMIEEQKEAVSGNVEKNVEFVKTEGPKFFEFVQKETKIYTKEDLKRWAGEQLKLATLCLNEFMKGYRSGRDGEMDKMLNEYFKEEEEEAVQEESPKRKRRKSKRLVRTA